MLLLFTLIIVMTVCGGLAKSFPLRFTMAITQEPIQQRYFEKDLSSDAVKEIYDTYYSIEDHKEEHLNVISQFQHAKIKYSHFHDVNREPYLLVKTTRHRNKRYSSYLTLCPFKICNMGRKITRTRRYVHMIRAADDNEES